MTAITDAKQYEDGCWWCERRLDETALPYTVRKMNATFVVQVHATCEAILMRPCPECKAAIGLGCVKRASSAGGIVRFDAYVHPDRKLPA